MSEDDAEPPTVEMECGNYWLCGEKIPYYFYVKSKGVCIHCDMFWGNWDNKVRTKHGSSILKVLDKVECSVCLEDDKKGAVQPTCTHTLCIECFKEIYHGYTNKLHEKLLKDIDRVLPFPAHLVHLKEIYYDNPDSDELKRYPEIEEYRIKEDILWERKDDILCAEAEDKHKCPICRAKWIRD
jgi:hypothetical protein